MPISTFPRHDYDEDEYLLKPAGLRDTHSEGKVKSEIGDPKDFPEVRSTQTFSAAERNSELPIK
jgi:hypothetical protein